MTLLEQGFGSVLCEIPFGKEPAALFTLISPHLGIPLMLLLPFTPEGIISCNRWLPEKMGWRFKPAILVLALILTGQNIGAKKQTFGEPMGTRDIMFIFSIPDFWRMSLLTKEHSAHERFSDVTGDHYYNFGICNPFTSFLYMAFAIKILEKLIKLMKQ
ncbi:hypothetical protein DUI87_10127 [Hirundo rustica rustica]|uniref:Uncharacterized protein n=1 Tax=Hirundo rustica rustica TaxID=333673 RepID=A0A3M0KHP4_HIRRU|nr:hypothetical protein DUI87_10127 [Hirundo rustica rustica]